MGYASLSLDLDNQWSYMKTHGDQGWQEYPSYLELAVPRILDFLQQRNLRISFFIVGQDAALEKNKAALAQIAACNHEVGSHSFGHDPWLHLYTDEQLERDLTRAEEAIEAATGVRPRGFRGPGFSLSAATLQILARRGYRYDATVFPNLLNPLARAYFFATTNLSREEKQQRKALFGSWTDARRPVKPFRWRLADGELLEIPVTTMPIFKVPIHLSYLLYLAKFAAPAAREYFRLALFLCRRTDTAPSILLHPLDFMSSGDCPALRFFPGMDLPLERKLHLASEMLAMLTDRYEIVTVDEHASRAAAGAAVSKTRQPVFHT
jgi:hypothetical protein